VNIRVCCGHVADGKVTGGCGHGSAGDWVIEGPTDLLCPKCGAGRGREIVAFFLPTFVNSPALIGELGSASVFSFSKKTSEPYFTLTPEEQAAEDEPPDV
jgi:hypothetical protein